MTRDGMTIWCGDWVKRKCYIRVMAWLADHMENCTIHAAYNTRCGICECPADELRDYTHTYSCRDQKFYLEWVKNSDMGKVKTAGVKLVSNALWSLRDVMPSNLIRLDLLYNILLEIMEYLMDWIEWFLTACISRDLDASSTISDQLYATKVIQQFDSSLKQGDASNLAGFAWGFYSCFTSEVGCVRKNWWTIVGVQKGYPMYLIYH